MVFMKARLRVSAALVRTEIAAIRAERPDLAGDALRQFVHSHRETVRLTRSRANVRRLRAAHSEIEAEIARRRRNAAGATR